MTVLFRFNYNALMSHRKPYNPNTRYGRTKLREQAAEMFAHKTSDRVRNRDNLGCLVLFIIVIVMSVLFFLISIQQAALNWLTR